VRERLVEDWLDKINERGYQSAFCHWLAWRGFRVLHSTRHTPIEFGKDVVALADEERLYAFQLKGDPGGRMTFKDWQALLPQITTLVTHLWPGPETERCAEYIPVLVTNGEVDEDARSAIQQFNTGPLITGKVKPLQIWSRGDLLSGFLDMGAVSWPTDIRSNQALLNAIASSGEDLPDFEAMDTLLTAELSNAASQKSGEFVRRCLGTLLVVELYLGSAQRAENHFALLALRMMARNYILATFHERGEIDQSLISVCAALRGTIVDSIRSLIEEAKKKEKDGTFIESMPLHDFINFDFRALLLVSLFGVDALDRFGKEEQDPWVIDLILKQKRPLPVWGEGAVPQHLAIYWLHRSCSGATDSDARLAAVLQFLLSAQLSPNADAHLASPYYRVDEVLERTYRNVLHRGQLPIDRDTSRSMSTFVIPITRIIARLNWKGTLRLLWPSISKIIHRYTEPSSAAAYLRLRDDAAIEVQEVQLSEKAWDDLLTEAKQPVTWPNEDLLWPDAPMHLLHIILFPHRATPEAVRNLDVELWRDRLRLRV
jgi:hypothetical protein